MARQKQSTAKSFLLAARKIRALAGYTKRAAQVGLRGIGEEILTDVKASAPGHGVPVDKGNLRASGMTEQVSPTTVEISFGGDAAPYALTQHENMDYHHTVGEARYLVRGLERWKPDGSPAMDALQHNAQEGVRKASKA